jgi:5,10-methylenetetrahydromethanopterin reductase
MVVQELADQKARPSMGGASSRVRPQYSVLLVGDDIVDWRQYIASADRLGFWGLGTGDSQSLYPDVYVRMGLAAMDTGVMRIGPLVTNPVTRHPAVTAGAIATIDQLSQGRAFLGIGAGDSSMLNIGQHRSRLGHLEAYVEAVNQLMDTGEARWDGRTIKCAVPKRRVPIYMAAAAPGAMALAGRIADGVILGSGLTAESVSFALETIRRGAEEAGRPFEDLDIWWLAMTNIAEDSREALREIRNSLVTHAHATFEGGFKGKSLPEHFHEGVRRIVEDYRPMEHAKFLGSHHVGLLGDPALEAYLKTRFAICGSPDEVADQLRAANEAGARKIWFSVRIPNKRRVLRLWERDVLPFVS